MKYLKKNLSNVCHKLSHNNFSHVSYLYISSFMSLILLSLPFTAHSNPRTSRFKATVTDPDGRQVPVQIDSSSDGSSDEEMHGQSLRERGRVNAVKIRRPQGSFGPIGSDARGPSSGSGSSSHSPSRSGSESSSPRNSFILSVVNEDGTVETSFELPSEEENAKVLSAARLSFDSGSSGRDERERDSIGSAVGAVTDCSHAIQSGVSPVGAGAACGGQGQGRISPFMVAKEKLLSGAKQQVVAAWQGVQKGFKKGQRIEITEKGTGRKITIALDKALGKGMWGQVFKVNPEGTNVNLSLNGKEYDGDVVVKFGHVLVGSQDQNISSKVRIRAEADIYEQFNDLKPQINEEVNKLMSERRAHSPWSSSVLPVCPILEVSSDSAGAAAAGPGPAAHRLKTHFGPIIFKPFLRGQFLENMTEISKEQEEGLQDMFDYVKAVDIAYRNDKVRKAEEEVKELVEAKIRAKEAKKREKGESVDPQKMEQRKARYAAQFASRIEEAKKARFNTDLRPTNLIWLDDPSVYKKYGYERPGWFLIEQDSAPGNYIDGMTISKYKIELDGYLSAARAKQAAAERKATQH